jgi:hypothetical protein
MTRLTMGQLLLSNLAEQMPIGGWGYMTKEAAREQLKKLTGQDFGYDLKAWKTWLREHRKEFPDFRLR